MQRNGGAETGDIRNSNGVRSQGNEGGQRDEAAATSTRRSEKEEISSTSVGVYISTMNAGLREGGLH